MTWRSPLPGSVTGAVRVIRPTSNLCAVAGVICDGAWRGKGVRVFRWPCGTLVIAVVGSPADQQLLRFCLDRLLGTYARHGLLSDDVVALGPSITDVVHDLRWARAKAA